MDMVTVGPASNIYVLGFCSIIFWKYLNFFELFLFEISELYYNISKSWSFIDSVDLFGLVVNFINLCFVHISDNFSLDFQGWSELTLIDAEFVVENNPLFDHVYPILSLVVCFQNFLVDIISHLLRVF